MKKTYWWRILVLFLGLLVFFGGLIYKYISSQLNGLGLILITFIKPIVWSSMFFIFVSLILFFVSDFVFKKWLKFAIIWFALAAIFIAFAPTSSTQVIGNPTKETVSIWMSSLFVIISLVQLITLSIKQKRG